jgi:hypothetical protein
MIITYRILINEQKDSEGRHIAMWDGYKSGDPLICTWTAKEEFEVIGKSNTNENDVSTILEDLFERFNIHHPKGYRNRSLSVGDVVTLDIQGKKSAYAVDRFGFKEVDYPEYQSGLCHSYQRNQEKQGDYILVCERYAPVTEALECIKAIEAIEPDSFVLVILEDIDEMVNSNEHAILELFDGQDN